MSCKNFARFARKYAGEQASQKSYIKITFNLKVKLYLGNKCIFLICRNYEQLNQ